MTKARTLADMISDGVIGTTELADDAITPVKLDETGNYTIAQLDVNGTVTAGDLTLLDGTPIINITDTDTGVDHQINASSGIGNLAINVDTNGEGSNAGLIFRVGGSGTANQYFRMAANGDTRFYDSSANTMLFIDESVGVAINDDGADKDFRVESSGYSHALFVDASSNRIALGGGGSDPNATVGIFSVTSSEPLLRLAGRTNGEIITQRFQGANTSGTLKFGDISFVPNAEEINFRPIWNGSNMFTIQPSESTINQDGVNHDFRVESDTYSHMLFVDAGSNFVSVGSVNTTLGSGFSVTPTASYGNTVTHRAADGIGGSGQRANMTSGILTIDTTSSGNQLTIPVTYSGSFWAQYYVRLVVVSAEYNMTSAKAGEATFAFGAATSIANLTTLSTTGNITSIGKVNASSPNPHTLQINFSNAYTAGLNNWEGIQLYYEIVSSWPDRIQMQNAALN